MQRIHERTVQYTNDLRELRCDIGRIESWRKSWNVVKFAICGELGVDHLMSRVSCARLARELLDVRYDGRTTLLGLVGSDHQSMAKALD